MKHKWSIAGFVVAAIAAFIVVTTSAAAPPREETLPLIEMENVPLTEALRKLAGQARLNILLDPRLSSPPFDRVTVSVRWQNVTAREALTALLDNHGLVLVETPRR